MGRILKRALERKETMMKTHALLKDADGLIALAECVATVFSERRDELNIDTEMEALLRLSIAGASYAINIYLSALAHARTSPLARQYRAEAKRHCRRNVERLRRRVRDSIAYLSRLIREKQLIRSMDQLPV